MISIEKSVREHFITDLSVENILKQIKKILLT